MIQASLELYLDGQWKEFHLYNQLVFDDRKDGQLASGMCYIRTEEKVRFKPMRKARLNLIEDDVVKKQYYYFAYFKSQKTDLEYWMHEVTLIDPAKRVQGEMINGLRVVQNESNSISLYDTFVRLCNTTPLRLTTQENVYNPAVDGLIIPLMKKIRSPEYAWSCRTLFWECLKEIGMDMGGYFPTVSFGENGKYVISFIPTENIVKTVTDFPYFSYAEGEDINQVCSEIDTDISNVIATNQGTASVVFPSQNGWITPRTDDVRLTDSNCEIQTPNIIEKPIKILLSTEGIRARTTVTASAEFENLDTYIKRDFIDVTKYFVEKKKYESLQVLVGSYRAWETELYKNNTSYWIENSNKLFIAVEEFRNGVLFHTPKAICNLIQAAIYDKYWSGDSSTIIINEQKKTLGGIDIPDIREIKFRIEYISRNTSSKIRAVKQEKCGYEYVQPFNQRAEIVDASSLGKELNKTVNQMGVSYIKAAWRYQSLNDILPIGTAFVKDSETYILTVNECELTSHDNILVTHTFCKGWSMISSYLKQNKAYRNTKIPTDTLVRNLYYRDYFIISDKILTGEKGLLTERGVKNVSRVFGDRLYSDTEINNFGLYKKQQANGNYDTGVVISADSLGCANSILLSAKLQNNLTAGKQVEKENDYYCKEVLYTNDNGEFIDGTAKFVFGSIMKSTLYPHLLPESNIKESPWRNAMDGQVLEEEFSVEKSSAEHINFTYQVPFVSDMTDIVIGSDTLIANNCPLVHNMEGHLQYRLWGLKLPLMKSTVAVNSVYGTKIVDITYTDKKQYWTVENVETANSKYFSLNLTLQGKMQGNYIGWAITDENGYLYVARNSKPNENQVLYFNHLHNYHEQE